MGSRTVLVFLGVCACAQPASSQFPVFETTIREIRAAMDAGEVSARELVERSLARIEAFDDNGPALNAVLMVNPNALERADALDRAFARSGSSGALHGIPVILKDNVETHDMPTTGGSRALAGWIPPSDAFLTKRLRDAGAIIIAKVNLTEFAATGITRSSLGGQTLNPYDLTRTPGGSSGGTGAAIAASYGVIGIGTDTVNSIRSPSSANNLVGIRPTRGLVSRTGIIPYSLSQDTAGPIARTVADAATMLAVIAGYDPSDPVTARSVGHVSDYGAELTSEQMRGARLGVLRSFFGDAPHHLEVTRVVEAALSEFRRLGAETIDLDVNLDADELIRETSVSIFEFDAHLSSYLEAKGAPARSLRAIVASGVYEPALESVYRAALERSTEEPEYTRRLLAKTTLQERVLAWMADQKLDAVIYPLQKRLVVPIGEDQLDRNGILGAITGFPAVTLPAGFSAASDDAPIGVPVGVELLGRPFSEVTLLRLAYAYEQASHKRAPPRSTPALIP